MAPWGNRARLDMAGLEASHVQQRKLRSDLAALEKASPEARDDLTYQIAPELLVVCQVDVLGACRASNSEQRQAIVKLLRPAIRPRER